MSALRATTSLIFVQVFSRLSTFAINQASLRYLSPALLGASTQLELLATTILTFARDSLRVALSREGFDPNLQGVVNAAHLPWLIGIPLSLAFKYLYESSGLPDVPGMASAVNWICIASIVEMLAEPAFALVQVSGDFGVRAQAETTGTVMRCIVTFAAVVYGDSAGLEAGVLPFAYGQMAYAATVLLTYLFRIGPVIRARSVSLVPRPVKTTSKPPAASTRSKTKTSDGKDKSATQDVYLLGFFSSSLLWLSITLSTQTIVKQLLGEGDHVIMAMFASLSDQGSYDLAHNYGSLIARILFQPIEEGCRGLFGRLCAGAEDDAEILTDESGKESEKEKAAAAKGMNKNLTQAKATLELVVKLYSIFSLWLCAVGPALAPLALRVIAGAKWSNTSAHHEGVGNSAGDVLASYVYLLPFLAFNGITEAFVSAVASPGELYQQSIVMSLFTPVFMGAGYVFLGVLHWGAHGLIAAQAIAMFLRILWSWWFSRHWFSSKDLTLDLRVALPNAASIAFGAMCVTVMRCDVYVPGIEEVLARVKRAAAGGDGWVGKIVWVRDMDVRFVKECYTKGLMAVITTFTLAFCEQEFLAEQWELVSPTVTGGVVEGKKTQ